MAWIWHSVHSDMADAETLFLPVASDDLHLSYLYKAVPSGSILCADCATRHLHNGIPLVYAIYQGLGDFVCEECSALIPGQGQ